MLHNFLKKRAISLVARGYSLPEIQVSRFQELVMLKQLLEALKINCVLDVGANDGQYVRELRGIGYRGQIISFEPVGREFLLLSESLQGDPNWRGHHIALGSRDMTATMHVPAESVMSSLLPPLRTFPGTQMEEVEVRRLDALLPTLIEEIANPRIFLKMDTQGYDLEVFRGAECCHNMILGLQSEISVHPLYDGMPHYLDSLKEYESAGFELYNLSLVTRTKSRNLRELNCFMRRS
jgi:FkbM family methyltransferase